ncbi:MAG TPA: DUF488 domain-containing protein [Acidimicrobiia bacterium]|nr:DUF488 domain-containing protein [Acidimicrobiia bacterium]
MSSTIFTVGHGTLNADAFVALLEGAAITCVADVRSFPGSRHNPQFRRENMEHWVADAGIEYLWMRALGGRRRLLGESRHVALRNAAFRAYADYMGTPEFLSGVDELLTVAQSRPATVMCSETVWWRCHRRLLADYLTLVRGTDVVHLMHDGRLVPHPLTDGVRVTDSTVVYDLNATPPLPT